MNNNNYHYQPPHNQNQQTSGQSNPQNQPLNSQPTQQPSGLMQIVGAVLPALLEHFTGQKISTGGNNGEIQLFLSQILHLQQQIIISQQDLNKRLVNLEINASQQLTDLVQQVQGIKSIRLSHSKETKAVDYNLQQQNHHETN
jgi:hypothetical protein